MKILQAIQQLRTQSEFISTENWLMNQPGCRIPNVSPLNNLESKETTPPSTDSNLSGRKQDNATESAQRNKQKAEEREFVLDLVSKLPEATQAIIKQMPALSSSLPVEAHTLDILERWHKKLGTGEALNAAEQAALVLVCNMMIAEGIALREKIFYITGQFMKESLMNQASTGWFRPNNFRHPAA